jgi:hypothetical protein
LPSGYGSELFGTPSVPNQEVRSRMAHRLVGIRPTDA